MLWISIPWGRSTGWKVSLFLSASTISSCQLTSTPSITLLWEASTTRSSQVVSKVVLHRPQPSTDLRIKVLRVAWRKSTTLIIRDFRSWEEDSWVSPLRVVLHPRSSLQDRIHICLISPLMCYLSSSCQCFIFQKTQVRRVLNTQCWRLMSANISRRQLRSSKNLSKKRRTRLKVFNNSSGQMNSHRCPKSREDWVPHLLPRTQVHSVRMFWPGRNQIMWS